MQNIDQYQMLLNDLYPDSELLIVSNLMPSAEIQANIINYLNQLIIDSDSFKHSSDSLANTVFQIGYNNIKDPSWPNLKNYKDIACLPSFAKLELADLINDIESQLKELTSFFIHPGCGPQQKTKIKQVVYDNKDIIIGRRVVDLATRDGCIGFACLKLGADSVLLTDARKEHILACDYAASLLGYSEQQVKAVQSDLNDYDQTTALCKGADTVILSGLLYHVHNHYDILQSICQGNPNDIIFETRESRNAQTECFDSQEPIILYNLEPSAKFTNGVGNTEVLLVGSPNLAWFKLAMNQLGYRLVKTDTYRYVYPLPNVNLEVADRRTYHFSKSESK